MIEEAAEREAQSGQLITDTAGNRKREEVIWGEVVTDLYESFCFCSFCVIWSSPPNLPLFSVEPEPIKKR